MADATPTPTQEGQKTDQPKQPQKQGKGQADSSKLPEGAVKLETHKAYRVDF